MGNSKCANCGVEITLSNSEIEKISKGLKQFMWRIKELDGKRLAFCSKRCYKIFMENIE